MHHGQDNVHVNRAMSEIAKAQLAAKAKEVADAEKLGATGRFPEGKLLEDDEGEIKLAIGHKDGKVIINFGTPVTWIGFSPQQAREIAELLRQHSHQCK